METHHRKPQVALVAFAISLLAVAMSCIIDAVWPVYLIGWPSGILDSAFDTFRSPRGPAIALRTWAVFTAAATLLCPFAVVYAALDVYTAGKRNLVRALARLGVCATAAAALVLVVASTSSGLTISAILMNVDVLPPATNLRHTGLSGEWNPLTLFLLALACAEFIIGLATREAVRN